MSTISSTAQDIITGALRNLNVLAASETPSASDSADALMVLNDLLESWSIDHLTIYSVVENILTYTPGQYQYTVGNPTGGTFSGTITSGSTAILGVSPVPSGVIASSTSAYGTGSTVTDTYSCIPSGTTIYQSGVPIVFTGTVNSGATSATLASVNGGSALWPYASGTQNVTFANGQSIAVTFTNGSAAVTWSTALTSSSAASGNTVTSVLIMSAAATATPSTNPETITYTTPGNFAIARPLRITNAFTRITVSGSTGLDYPIDFEGGRDKYTAIGLKGLAGPWPIVGWYNPTFPYGNVYFYPNPSSAGVLHLFTDTILTDFSTLTQSINLPQGFARALKKNLAVELAPEYGKGVTPILQRQADESLKMIKSLNSTPAVQAFYDTDIVRGRRNDAGWILSGGFI